MDAITQRIEEYLKKIGKDEQLAMIIMNRQGVEIQTKNKLTGEINKKQIAQRIR